MAGLQRSSETFRRSGSSGTVWEDKYRSASGELVARPAAQAKKQYVARQQRSGSSGHGSGYRAGRVQPALDPPSPRVAACGFCSLFGKEDRRPVERGAGGRRRANVTGGRRR